MKAVKELLLKTYIIYDKHQYDTDAKNAMLAEARYLVGVAGDNLMDNGKQIGEALQWAFTKNRLPNAHLKYTGEIVWSWIIVPSNDQHWHIVNHRLPKVHKNEKIFYYPKDFYNDVFAWTFMVNNIISYTPEDKQEMWDLTMEKI